MNPARLGFIFVIGLTVLSVISTDCAFARTIHTAQTHTGKNKKTSPKPSTRLASTRSTTQAVALDEDQVEKARQKLEAVATSLQSAFEQSSQWTSATAALTQAESAYAAASARVVSNLQKNSDYIAAVEAKKTASDSLDSARNAANPSPETVSSLASAVLDSSTKVSKIESGAMEADAGVTTSRASVASASAHLAQLKSDFQSTLKDNSDWQQAKKDYDAVQAKLAADYAKLAAGK
jgi:hypothetical protein